MASGRCQSVQAECFWNENVRHLKRIRCFGVYDEWSGLAAGWERWRKIEKKKL
jgi:hypothetical protein